MRHIASLVAGLLIAPLAWVLLAAGQTGSVNVVDAWGQAHTAHPADLARPALYLAAAGLLLGLVASLRVSPVGPLLAGIAYAAVYLAMFANPSGVHDLMPGTFSALGRPVDPQIPLDNGTGLLLGALLIVAVASPSRWRRWPRAQEATVPVQREEADQPLGAFGAAPANPAPANLLHTSSAPISPAPTGTASAGIGLLPSGALTNPTPNPFIPRLMPTVANRLPRRPIRRSVADQATATGMPADAASPSQPAARTPPEWPPSTAGDPSTSAPAIPAGSFEPGPANFAAFGPTSATESAIPSAEAASTDPEDVPRPHRSPWIAPPGGTTS